MSVKIIGVAALLICTGCDTVRPTVTGIILDERSGVPAGGAIVSIRKGDSPLAISCAITDWQGKFSLEGDTIVIAPNEFEYRVRAHRDDLTDAIYDFHYTREPSSFLWFPRHRDIGRLTLRVPVAPTTVPAPPESH